MEDSVTSGRIRIVCASEAYDLISRERAAFQDLYPQASIHLVAGSSRGAVSALFGAECDLAVLSRELEPSERKAAREGGLELEGYRFARNAVRIVVHPGVGVENLALEDVRRIYRAEIHDWSEIGGPAIPIVPVIQSTESDLTEFFSQEVLGGEEFRARAFTAASDSELIARVARTPGAIGYISLGTPVGGVRVARIAPLRGLPYWKPDLEAIHRGDYPLTRFYNLYVRSKGPKLAAGFVTFVTSIDGQRLVRDAGLVPTTVPVRFVRRSPMLSTHSRGDSVPTP